MTNWKVVPSEPTMHVKGITFSTDCYVNGILIKAGTTLPVSAPSPAPQVDAPPQSPGWWFADGIKAAAKAIAGRRAGRNEGSELWLEIGKIERIVLALAAQPDAGKDKEPRTSCQKCGAWAEDNCPSALKDCPQFAQRSEAGGNPHPSSPGLAEKPDSPNAAEVASLTKGVQYHQSSDHPTRDAERLADAARKLATLADMCSDEVYGGECGWESVDFKEFVAKVRAALRASAGRK